MKTINDLVDRLNSYGAYGEFYIRKGKNDNYLLCKRYTEGGDATLFDFAKGQPYWSIYPSLGAMHNQVQKDIMDFVYTTDKEHWFDKPEKKYYIAVGMYDRTSKLIYFKNDNALDFKLRTMIDFDEKHLQEDDIFTESEIEQLKATLPENMAKIVDLGKVEVKND